MPTYTFLDPQANVEFSDFMSISEMETFLKENAHIQLVPSAPAIHSGRGLGKKRVDDSFNDVLKEIKKNNSKGVSKSTVNTW